MSAAPKLQVVPESGLHLDERPPLVEAGTYEAVFVKRWIGYMYGRAPKLAITFRITSPGPAFGRKVVRYYNVKSFSKKRGDFKIGWSSDLVREYAALFGMPRQLKEVTTAPFRDKIILIRVRTVSEDRKQRKLHPDLHYSVVDELLKVAT